MMHVMPLQAKLMPWHWLTKTFRENYLITGHTFRFCNLRFPAKVTTWYDVISFGSSFFFNSARSQEYGTTSQIFGLLHLNKFKMLLLSTCYDFAVYLVRGFNEGSNWSAYHCSIPILGWCSGCRLFTSCHE